MLFDPFYYEPLLISKKQCESKGQGIARTIGSAFVFVTLRCKGILQVSFDYSNAWALLLGEPISRWFFFPPLGGQDRTRAAAFAVTTEGNDDGCGTEHQRDAERDD
jgi:hypothetical protein